MNIIEKVVNSFRITKKEILKSPFTTNIIQRFGTNSYGALSTKDYLAEYKNWVYACVKARSEEVGNIKLKLLNKDGEEIKEHPLLDLISRVNLGMTQTDLFEYTQAFKDLDGNAFWYLLRDNKGTIQEIYVLKPDCMRIVISKENPLYVEGYLYKQTDGQVIPFEPTEILHFKDFDPRAQHPFPHKGMGIVEAAAFAIDTDNEARNWNLNFFKNAARPDGILYTDGEGAADSDDYKRVKEEWKEEHAGSGNAHKLTVLSGGLKYVELTRTQKDMDFVNQRGFSRDEILALFRTPKSIIGITDDVTRANADAAVYVFALRTIKPLMQKIVNTLNEFLVPEYGDDIKLDFVSPVTEDHQEALAEYTAGHNKWLSTNDIRRKENLPVTKNGEKLYGPLAEQEIDETPDPTTIKPTKSLSKKPVSKAQKGKKKSIAEEAVENIKVTKSMGEKSVDNFLGKLPKSKREKNALIHKGMGQVQEEMYISGWKKRMASTGPLKKQIKDFFNEQEKEVMGNLADNLKQYKSITKAPKGLLFNPKKAISAGINLITPFIEQYIKDSGEIAADAVGGEFDYEDAKVQDFIPKRAEYFAETINDTTNTDLLNSISEGQDAGETLEEISQRVADIYGKARDFRTDMIARTEVAASSNFASIEAYKQAGVTQHQWIVVSPEDEDCLENDGEIVDIGDAFPNGDTEPPVHPNCQCTTIPIFDDSEEE